MASQKPPVAFVRRVTLIFSFAAPLPLADGAAAALPLADGAEDGAAEGATDGAAAALPLADGAAVPPPVLPLQAVMSSAAAPSTTNAFSRVDMCVAPSCRIFLV